jgi:hypothetical protein
VAFNLQYAKTSYIIQTQNTGTARTLNQLWCWHSRRFVPELWCQKAQAHRLINRSESH